MAGILAGASKSYGAWYEGEQQNASYWAQANLTWRQKEEAAHNIAMEEQQAKYAQGQVDYAVEKYATINEINLKNYQRDTDKGLSTAYAKGAKSGVDMAYGSPLEVMGDLSEQRAYGYVLTKGAGEAEAYEATSAMQQKATIMLDKINVDKANLGMYDYQAAMFISAAGEARKVAEMKKRSAEYESTSAGFQRGMSFISG